MSSDLPKQIQMMVAAFLPKLQHQAEVVFSANTPDDFQAAEMGMVAQVRELADYLTAVALQAKLAEPEFQAEVNAAAYAGPTPLRSGGRKDVGVTLLGGTTIRVKVAYLKRDYRGQRGRKRTKRRKNGSGLYPALAVLGIWHGVTPALAEEICYQGTGNDSIRVARAMLARRGIDLGHKQTLKVINQFGRRLHAQRQQWLQQAREQSATSGGPLAGNRVVVSTDGGRLRVRCPKRGRRRLNGHRAYETPWREPKALTIHVVGANGKLDRAFVPVYDASLGDCDATFEMLLSYLRALGAQEAECLLLIGDGAQWIWNDTRLGRLVEGLGIAAHRVRQLIDWYHAVEKLGEIAKTPAKWNSQQRQYWLRWAKGKLWNGDIAQLLVGIDRLAVGRRAKTVNKHRAYFADNVERMQYATFAKDGLPTGSGSVESAIRRIVNQRLKAPGTFWLEENAEHMLLMRSYLKSGRWHSLISWSLAVAVPWWPPAQSMREPSIGPLSTPKSTSDATMRGYV